MCCIKSSILMGKPISGYFACWVYVWFSFVYLCYNFLMLIIVLLWWKTKHNPIAIFKIMKKILAPQMKITRSKVNRVTCNERVELLHDLCELRKKWLEGPTFIATTRWRYWPRSAWLWFGFQRGKVLFWGVKGLRAFSIHNLSTCGLYISLACFHLIYFVHSR